MRFPRWLLLMCVVQAATVAALAAALAKGRLPLGIPGEWEWTRLRVAPGASDLAIAASGVAGFAAFAALGLRAHRRGTRRGGAWLAWLVVASALAQATVLSGAPLGYGLSKWVTLALPEASGYATVARRQAADPWRFWAEYPDWIRRQDSLHVGTHPPGLFLWARAADGLMKASPTAAAWVDSLVPYLMAEAFRQIVGPLTRAERSALVLTGALTLLACAATVVPLYALARWSGLSAAEAWSSAALWPLLPSALMFQPTADTAFPLLSTAALALAVRARAGPAFVAGVVLGVGMLATLAFLPVGLAVALVLAGGAGDGKRRAGRIVATGAGFLAFTLATWAVSRADPFVIWWWNQRNHARFYVEFRRSYAPWLAANAVELIVALGLPTALWAAVGAARKPPRAFWATLIVLAILNLSGRNLSEVGRLWLPLMPPLLLAAGAGLVRTGGGPASLGWSVALVGIQSVALQSTIQVVWPQT